jgi:hypothetical protein
MELLAEAISDDGYDGLGEYDPSEKIRTGREVLVGDPQLRVKEKDRSVTSILRELAAIQQQGPQKYCILGTRHCSYLHQQIIELLYVSDWRRARRRYHVSHLAVSKLYLSFFPASALDTVSIS